MSSSAYSISTDSYNIIHSPALEIKREFAFYLHPAHFLIQKRSLLHGPREGICICFAKIFSPCVRALFLVKMHETLQTVFQRVLKSGTKKYMSKY